MGLGRLNPGCQQADPCVACEPVPCCDARRVRITIAGLTDCVSSLNGDYTLSIDSTCRAYNKDIFYSEDFFAATNCIPIGSLTADCTGWTVPSGTIGGGCGGVGLDPGVGIISSFEILFQPTASYLQIGWKLHCFGCGSYPFTNACGPSRPSGYCSPNNSHLSGFRWFNRFTNCFSGDLGQGNHIGYAQISDRPSASVLLEL